MSAPRRRLGDVLTAAGPAERGPDPGDQLGQVEGLADVVVGAGLEPDHDVHRVGPGREHHDRDGRGLPDLAADLVAVEPRQHDVEEDEVERVGPEAVEALDAVGGGRDLEAGRTQPDRGHLADRRVILDEQDPRIRTESGLGGAGSGRPRRSGGLPHDRPRGRVGGRIPPRLSDADGFVTTL